MKGQRALEAVTVQGTVDRRGRHPADLARARRTGAPLSGGGASQLVSKQGARGATNR
jgi:hypothetical protein